MDNSLYLTSPPNPLLSTQTRTPKKMTHNTVPNAPEPDPNKIDHKSKHNLEKWITYFRSLSPRITIYQPSEPGFEIILRSCKHLTIDYHGIEEEYYKLETWPEKNDIAFIIHTDLSQPGQVQFMDADSFYIFMFNDKAFGLTYFSLEGDLDDCNRDTYSIREMLPGTLNWEHVGTDVIPDRIQEVEKCVPEFPK